MFSMCWFVLKEGSTCAWESLSGVGLPLGLRLPGGGSISQEVRPEDKMAANSQNDDIITLSVSTRSYFQIRSCPDVLGIMTSTYKFWEDTVEPITPSFQPSPNVM
jgi:hypothetical protein